METVRGKALFLLMSSLLALASFGHGLPYDSSEETPYHVRSEEAAAGSNELTPSSVEKTTHHYTTEAPTTTIETTTTEPTTTELTTTTTTTQRPLEPFEIQTNNLISQNSESMGQLQLDMLKYQTQLNLNTLEAVLPVLEAIRQNMTTLLETPLERAEEFQAQSKFLENEFIEAEEKLNGNRQLVEKYTQIQADTRKQLEIVQKSLGSIFHDQVQSLIPQRAAEAGDSNPDEKQISSQQIEAFMNNFVSGNKTGDELLTFLRSLRNEESRILGYGQAVRLFQDRTLDPYLAPIAFDIFKSPELERLRESVPSPVIRTICSPEPKAMEMRLYSRQLAINREGSLLTWRQGRESSKVWKFYLVPNSRYFVIGNSVQEKIIGVAPSPTRLPSDVFFKTVVNSQFSEGMTNPHYQWEITYRNEYAQLVNRLTGLALDANDNDQVYPHSKNGGGNQDWEIHL